MPQSADLVPEAVLIEIGRIAATWSSIEQEILLHTSALAAQSTDGWPTDYLFLPFQKLRGRWFELASAALDKKRVNKLLTPLNMKLKEYAEERNTVIHGQWTRVNETRFQCRYWKQTTDLQLHMRLFTVEQLQELTSTLRSLLSDVRAVVS